MDETALDELRFPVGKFRFPEDINPEQIEEWKDIVAGLPELLEQTVEDLDSTALSWKYRPGGWTIRQVVHHLADSHMNSLIRFKLALTEDDPVIKPYLEGQWAETTDTLEANITLSLDILWGVHGRWSILMDSMKEEDWSKTYTHPEHGRKLRLDQTLALYAWHCDHHLAHIHQAISSGGEYND